MAVCSRARRSYLKLNNLSGLGRRFPRLSFNMLVYFRNSKHFMVISNFALNSLDILLIEYSSLLFFFKKL